MKINKWNLNSNIYNEQKKAHNKTTTKKWTKIKTKTENIKITMKTIIYK